MLIAPSASRDLSFLTRKQHFNWPHSKLRPLFKMLNISSKTFKCIPELANGSLNASPGKSQ